MFSTIYLAEYVKVATVLALMLGFDIDEQVLTETILTLVAVGSSLYTLYARYKMGGVSMILGVRK